MPLQTAHEKLVAGYQLVLEAYGLMGYPTKEDDNFRETAKRAAKLHTTEETKALTLPLGADHFGRDVDAPLVGKGTGPDVGEVVVVGQIGQLGHIA